MENETGKIDWTKRRQSLGLDSSTSTRENLASLDFRARELPEDSAIWLKLFEAVAQNEEMLEVLQYTRACKARLKPHTKHGYWIDRELFSEKAQEAYNKYIRPYLESQASELLAALKKIA